VGACRFPAEGIHHLIGHTDMADYSFLVGKRDSHATFWREGADEELAYARDWVPIAWLALFEPDDVVLVEEPLEAESSEQQSWGLEPPRVCATLIRERSSALANLRRRITRLERALPADLVRRVRDLEAALESSRSSCVQVLVTDIDLYVSFGNSAGTLRELVATMDSDDIDQWRSALSYVHAQMGPTFAEIRFPQAREAAVVGYLSSRAGTHASTGSPDARLFTRNVHFGTGWRSLVRPVYLKLLLYTFIAAIALMVWWAV
jgi:hypothetical protein